MHVAHLSAKGSLDQVRFAKQQGLRVTCEVTPHHFTLIDEDVQYDSRFKMNPPLAAREDRDALLAGLADGTVDCIATDHAPHEPALKDVEFDRAPFGILGFETAIALSLEQLVHTGRISLMRMVELFYHGPRPRTRNGAHARRRPACRRHDFLYRPQVDLRREGFAQQIAQFALRPPRIQGRADGHDRRRQGRLEAVIRRAKTARSLAVAIAPFFALKSQKRNVAWRV